MLGLSTSLADLTTQHDQADMLAMFDDAQNGEMETSGPIIGGDKLSNSLFITISNNAYMSGTRQSG